MIDEISETASMNNQQQKTMEQYWSTEGGDTWLQYLDYFEPMIAPIGRSLVSDTLTDEHKHIIDIGCGGGATTFRLASIVGDKGSIIGVDISEALIANCRQRARTAGVKNVEFKCGDAATIELPKHWAQLVISRFGVMFFKEPVVAFKHIGQSLSDGGTLAFSCWASLPENPWMNELVTTLGLHIDLPKPLPGAPGPFAFANTEYLTSILTDAGYKNIQVTQWTGELMIGSRGMSANAVSKFLFSTSMVVKSVQDRITGNEDEIFRQFASRIKQYCKDDGVYMPAKAWIVKANN